LAIIFPTAANCHAMTVASNAVSALPLIRDALESSQSCYQVQCGCGKEGDSSSVLSSM